MKILIAYYSDTGNTEKIAQTVERLLSDQQVSIARVRPVKDYRGPFIKVLSALFRRKPAVEAAVTNLEGFDLLVIGAPIWCGRPAPPINSYIEGLQNCAGRQVVTFVSSRVGGYRDSLRKKLEEKGLQVLEALAFEKAVLEETELAKLKEAVERCQAQ
ncbi:MAG: flavodoxin family protein [Candidatus Latescibacteria bacterium]|nr:flavodoxin family protein [Candidatus Latescibacterota bacterium]